MRQKRYGKLCAVLTLVLVLSFAAGCAANESQPVVTEDDLTPFSPAVLDSGGEAGEDAQPAVSVPEQKEYPYIWPAENMETSAERLRKQLIEENKNYTERFTSREELEAWVEERIKDARRWWEQQRALDPVIPPQEAANYAGQIFETLYGIDLTNKILRMSCDEQSLADPEVLRCVWRIHVGDVRDDSSMVEPPTGTYDQIECRMDATTGEIIRIKWCPSNEECIQIMETPMPNCFIPIKQPSGWHRGGWDETHPDYAATMQALIDEFTPLVSGSLLTNGSAITSVDYQLDDRGIEGETVNRLNFFVTCENGKTYLMQRNEAIQPYLEYDFDGYPLRAYYFYDTTLTDRP